MDRQCGLVLENHGRALALRRTGQLNIEFVCPETLARLVADGFIIKPTARWHRNSRAPLDRCQEVMVPNDA